MKTLKILSFFSVVFFTCLGLQPVFAQKSMTIKLGYGHSVEHPYHQGGLVFKDIVEKETNGRIRVELYPGSQLGTESEMTEQVKLGTLTGTITGRFEEMSIKLYGSGLPFMFRDLDHVEKMMRSPLGAQFFSYVEEKDLKMLAWTHSGFRQITNGVRVIRKPEDLKGLKLRTPPLDNILRTMQAFGASAVPLPFTEVYTALKTGVVDGQENPYINIWDSKFYEVQKYLTAINYIYIGSPFCVGLKWWKSLSAEDQKLIAKAGLACGDRVNSLTKEIDLRCKESIAKTGRTQITELTAKEWAAFVPRVKPVYDYYSQKGIVTEEFIKKVNAIK